MVVHSERAIALTCPACQLVQGHEFSLFRLFEPLQLICSCGFSQGHFRKRRKGYELDVLDVNGNRVRMLFSKRELFHTDLINVRSPSSGQKLGYLGNPQVVRETIETDAHSFPEVPTDFSNPPVMRQILDILQDLAIESKIRCVCDRPMVALDVYADRVELVCSHCASTVRISATTSEHVHSLARVGEIVMEPSYARHLEALKPLN